MAFEINASDLASFRTFPAMPFVNLDASDAFAEVRGAFAPFMPFPITTSSSTISVPTNYPLESNVIPKGRPGDGNTDLSRTMMCFVQRNCTSFQPTMLSLSSLNYMLWRDRDRFQNPDDVMDNFAPYGILAARSPTPASMDPNEMATSYAVNVAGCVETIHVWHHMPDKNLCPDVTEPNIYVGFLLQYVDLTPTLYDLLNAPCPPHPSSFTLTEYKNRAAAKRSAAAAFSAAPSAPVAAVSGSAPPSASGRSAVTIGLSGSGSGPAPASKMARVSSSSYGAPSLDDRDQCLQMVPYACSKSVAPTYENRFDYDHDELMPCYYLGRTVDYRLDPNHVDPTGARVRGFVFPRGPKDHIEGTNKLPVMTIMTQPKRHGMQWICS
jgi:hypothetical protein